MNFDSPLKGQSADLAVGYNLIFCGIIFSLLFIAFCILRRRMRIVYSANIINEATNKASHRVPDGFLKWIWTVWSISDEELLPWVGLDGFIYIQTIKLILGILVCLALPAIFILLPSYYYGSTSGPQVEFFIQLSALDLRRPNMLWLTTAFNYYMAIVVFWGLHMFYRNLSIYHQAYLYNPASGVSQVTMRSLARTIGSLDRARHTINYSSRSVILTGVSSKYTKQEILDILTKAQIKDVASVVFVQNRKRVRSILNHRNKSVIKVEKVLQKLYLKIRLLVANHRKLTESQLEKQLQDAERKTVTERRAYLRRLLQDSALLAEFRPTFTSKEGHTQDAFRTHYEEVLKYDDELIEAAHRFAADNNRFNFETSDNGSIVFMGREEDPDELNQEEQDILLHGKAVVSWSQFLTWKKFYRDYELNLYGTSMSIIVVFGSQRSAILASQTLLSCRPFSMNATMAPTANDIMWDNLYMAQAERLIRSLAANVLYVMVNILFTSTSFAVASALAVERFEQIFPALAWLIEEYPKLRGILKGILAPLFYNLFLLCAPYMLYGLAIFQGTTSKTNIQLDLMTKYTWFLFIQTFMMSLFAEAMVTVLEKLVTGKYGEILTRLKVYLPDYAAFFTNLILQRMAISLPMALISPGTLIFSTATRIFFSGNLRAKISAMNPNRIFIGAFYPEYLILVFIITLVYFPLAPVICLAGLAFYGVAYMVFRYHFIFTYEVPHESGGKYWIFLPTPILVGLTVSQLFSIMHYAFSNAMMQALVVIPLTIVTIGSIFFLQGIFRRRTLEVPLTSESMDLAIKLADRMQSKQAEMVQGIAQEVGEDTTCLTEEGMAPKLETIPSTSLTLGQSPAPSGPGTSRLIGLRSYETIPYDFGVDEERLLLASEGSKDQKDLYVERSPSTGPVPTFADGQAPDNPYCNPIMYKRFPLVYVPPGFFHILEEALQISRNGT